MQETGSVPGREDPLEEGMAAHSRVPAWRIPWTEGPGGPQSVGPESQTRLSNWHACMQHTQHNLRDKPGFFRSDLDSFHNQRKCWKCKSEEWNQRPWSSDWGTRLLSPPQQGKVSCGYCEEAGIPFRIRFQSQNIWLAKLPGCSWAEKREGMFAKA